MQELENVLEEIAQLRRKASENGNFNVAAAYENSMEIIRKHMNDSWISMEEEKKPEVGEYVLGTNQYDEVLVYHYGWNSPHTRKMFFHLCGSAADIIAWRPLPEPYHPKRKSEDWKENFLKKFDKRA